MPAGTRRKGSVGFTLVALLLLSRGVIRARRRRPPASAPSRPNPPTATCASALPPSPAFFIRRKDRCLPEPLTICSRPRRFIRSRGSRPSFVLMPATLIRGRPRPSPTRRSSAAMFKPSSFSVPVIMPCFAALPIPNTDAYQTPLGIVPMSPLGRATRPEQSLCPRTPMPGATPAVVGPVLQAGPGRRPGHARHLGTFHRGPGPFPAKDFDQFHHPPRGLWRG